METKVNVIPNHQAITVWDASNRAVKVVAWLACPGEDCLRPMVWSEVGRVAVVFDETQTYIKSDASRR